ncbi:hypothetical protein [Salmonella enterica]|nr:hypothetical protein [Salmonella enterica]
MKEVNKKSPIKQPLPVKKKILPFDDALRRAQTKYAEIIRLLENN